MNRLLLSALVTVALTACGGGGTLSLDLTDAPTDLTEVETFTVTLSKIEAHLAGTDAGESHKADDKSIDKDDSWHAIEVNKSFDMLKLQNDVTESLGELDLPEGKITQIRLFIDPNGTNQIGLKGGKTCAIDLSNVPTTGIKINHVFKALDVQDGKKTSVVVDLDIAESVTKGSEECAYQFKPVIKIKKSEVK